MKAITQTEYGSPDVLQLKEVDTPVPRDHEVLVKIFASAVNRTDCANLRAKPFFMRLVIGLVRPDKQIPGTQFAGIVEAVGKSVTSLSKGERVFGFYDEGATCHAQYTAINEKYVVTMPENISFEQAAACSEGVHYAFNFINKVDLKKGQDVLVNGATGAIGSAAVQLLKYFDANVTAVCATKNIDLVKSLGADRVIDYTKTDFTKDSQQFEYVFDTVGKSSFFKCYRMLKPGGIYISSDLGYLAQNLYLPFITPIIKKLMRNRRTKFPVPIDIKRSLLFVKRLIELGKFRAVIDKDYSLDNIAEAYRYVEKGHKTGNVIINVEQEGN